MNAPASKAAFVRPMAPTLGDLIDRHGADWTPANDGQAFDIADEIKLRLMVGGNEPLTKAQADYLMGSIL